MPAMDDRPILAVTLNPAVDQTLVLPAVAPGAVNRVHESHLDPAGKGINAARMARRLGQPACALGFLAGEIGQLIAHALRGEDVATAFTRVAGQTRVNVNLFETTARRGTSFCLDGPPIDAAALAAFRATLRPLLADAGVLILGGSLPPGVPPAIYAELIAEASGLGVPAILDAEGEPFRLGLAAGPALVKPNRVEAARALGRPLEGRAAVAAAARELVAHGAGAAVVSLGAAGAIAADRWAVWLATPLPVDLRSTVGSGDSMVAGLAVALARGESLEAGLRLGTAAGAATATVSGVALGSREEVEALLPRVRLERLC